MSKYKKIFSGLGLLSISTLIGAGVVACAKNPSPKDSSTEAIDQNNNQGNSTTPEQGKPEMPQNPAPGTDHNNQEKPEAPKEGTPTPEAPKTETPKNPEMSKENPKQNDNIGQDNGSNNNAQEENKPAPTPQPKPEPKVTVETKSMELTKFVDEKFMYIGNTESANETKAHLKSKVTEIENKKDVTDEEKLKQLYKLEKTFIEYSSKIEKYKAIINNDKFKSNKYNPNGLNGRLAKLFGNDPEGKNTEGELIWQIYETFRRTAFGKNPSTDKSGSKIGGYKIVPDGEKYKDIEKFKIIEETKKKNPGLTIEELEIEINKIVDFVITIAKKAAELNIAELKKYSENEEPSMLVEQLNTLVKNSTTINEYDETISVIHKTKDVINTAKMKNKSKETKDKMNAIKQTKRNEIIVELDKIKAELTKMKN
ncbi:hypothetical protein RRG46_00830 [Mycoplasmopsis cynos]|uniref:Lipoprotein n=1 Tax=Mycoplasmopsis cynos TaxID=171284 RepID=A0ABD8AJX1_9BACT|nr:hypothetical protein [Mycoplasmopsis cynos]UWV80744.1 hypothetical protein NW069_00870 [Mycoplasmopsis cynos]UWV86114.1 hypothetical protein NW063_04835 [Mycoplasmopsis cynos]WAM08498.1 hypothetical protein ONA03_02985 [Mycoplasmopsis cynos]WQQ20086.1 hypothetical protein RRG46_00830 [Mycoplasmopsis cynos]